MRRTLILCLFLCYVFSVSAQSVGNIVGRVIDVTGKPLPGATVILVNTADALQLKKASTDSSGHFTFQLSTPGEYQIHITMVGFNPYQSKSINAGEQSIDLGQITLQISAATQLKEVVINSRKPLIERKIDRTVINVDALATNQGISAADLLEKTPGIFIDPANGSISLEGKFGVTVYIDNRKSYLSGNDLLAYLQSLPSGALQTIELMTNPTARYDAAGNGGVINIRLKKHIVTGFNGSYTQLYGHWRYGKAEETFNFQYRRGKFNLAGNFNDNQQNWANSNTQSRTYFNPDGSPHSYYALDNFTHGKGYTLVPQLSLDYYATDKTTLGVTLGDIRKPQTTTGQTTSSFATNGGQPDSTLIQSFDNPHILRDIWGNLNYRHQFDQNGHELTADFDYNRFNITSGQNFSNSTTLPDRTVISQSQETGSTPTDITIYALKTDYTRPLKHSWKLEMGFKTSFTHTDNPATYFNTVNGISTPDYTKTNHFIYDENINAAYLNMSKDWKHFSAELGLRTENTNTKGDQLGNAIQRDSSFTNHYTSLFPTLFLQYKLDSAGVDQFGLNYGRRINRPVYQSLNPFVIPEDKYNYDVGNPYLNASFTQNLEFSYTHQHNLTVKLFYGKTTGDVEVLNYIRNGILYSSYGNLGYQQYGGLSVSGSLHLLKWLQFNGFGQVRFEHEQGAINGKPVAIDGTVGYFNGNMQCKLGKGWDTELVGFYQSKTNNFQYEQGFFGRFNVNLLKKFSPNFSARLVIMDPANLLKSDGTYNNLVLTNATFKSLYDDRGFNISLTYKFGKAIKDLRRHRSDASSDEQSRVKN